MKRENNLIHIREISVSQGLALWQKIALFALIGTTFGGFIVNPKLTTTVIVLVIIIGIFSIIVTYKFFVILWAGKGVVSITEGLIDELACPSITAMVAMYDEVPVLKQLVHNLSAMDYPNAKFQVLLILEEEDEKMRNAVGKMTLPSNFEVVIVPKDWYPGKGKPRALDYAGRNGFATGTIIVPFDAEDRPEPDQAKKAATALNLYPQISCFQAELRWYNATETVFTRMLSGAYASNFMWLAGLAGINGVVPLCGTSFYIRRQAIEAVGWWDMYNVTEDCDLGIKLARAKYRVMMLKSVTWEEATTTFTAQVKQGSRWTKGFTLTGIAHTRNPWKLFLDLGPKQFLSFLVAVPFQHPATLATPIFWCLTFVYWITGARIIEQVTPAPAFYVGTLCMFSNFLFVYQVWFSLDEEWSNQSNLTLWMLGLPIHWLTVGSAQAFVALLEITTGKKVVWRKTAHGKTTMGKVNRNEVEGTTLPSVADA